jgi:catechol 2,3-dioxygenase-like lactoylglutathione lyase family enzyme
MKKRTGDPWIPTEKYSHALSGLTVNMLVRDVPAHVEFVRDVLGLQVVYSDPDIAVYRWGPNEWMVHADHTYEDSDNPMKEVVGPMAARGAGVELRVHGCDPDLAEAAARERGIEVLAPSADKPHGLRETYIRDTDGYVWVPDVPVDPL